jgi:hypothetical protein
MPLVAEETTGKVLLSTTSRFVGEWKEEGFALSHAWPDFGDRIKTITGFSENLLCRNYFVASFETRPPTRDGNEIVFPDCTGYGNKICACLSVLFGKRFDNHGCFEASGRYHVPVNLGKDPILNPKYPIHGHKPRPDLAIQLNLSESARILRVLDSSTPIDPGLKQSFLTAARFYWLALQEFDADPERAFLDLVTCGEVIASTRHFETDDLLDEQTTADLERIEREAPDGAEIRKRICSRLRQVKRGFVRALTEPLNAHFFVGSEAGPHSPKLTPENIEKSLAAAYDVRSQYVHGGSNFGESVRGMENEEVVQCFSSAYEQSFTDLIGKSATFLGLERVLRFGMLSLLHRSGVTIDDRLASDTPHALKPADSAADR